MGEGGRGGVGGRGWGREGMGEGGGEGKWGRRGVYTSLQHQAKLTMSKLCSIASNFTWRGGTEYYMHTPYRLLTHQSRHSLFDWKATQCVLIAHDKELSKLYTGLELQAFIINCLHTSQQLLGTGI